MKKVLAAGGIVWNQYNEILFIYRRGKWDLPKGHLEKSETLERCALREVKEETDLHTLSIIKFIDITEHKYYDDFLKEDAIKETHWFAMTADKNEELHPLFIEGIEQICWIPKNDINKYIYNYYSNIIELFKSVKIIS